MRAGTLYCLAALALAKCAFGTLIFQAPKEDFFVTSACMDMQWSVKGAQSTVKRFDIVFEFENETEAFTKTTSEYFMYIEFPEEIREYKYFIQAFDKDNNLLDSSSNRTVLVADTVCYPTKIVSENIVSDGSFERVASESTWKNLPQGKSNAKDLANMKDDPREPHRGNYAVLMGAQDEKTDQAIYKDIKITKDTKFIAFWTLSAISRDTDFVELFLGGILIRNWTQSNHAEIQGKSISQDVQDYRFTIIDIPSEVINKCVGISCELRFRGYSEGLVGNKGLQFLIDDVIVGDVTSFSQEECEYDTGLDTKWCVSQQMCVEKSQPCTECSAYKTEQEDKMKVGCNWAEGCWYCFANGGRCIEEGKEDADCPKNCTEASTINCWECQTTKKEYFYLNAETECPTCFSFSENGSAVCAEKHCSWCANTETCEANEGDCKTCEYFTSEDDCTTKTTSCMWCNSQKKCLSLDTECTVQCGNNTNKDDCDNAPDCGWCLSSEKCLEKRIFTTNPEECPDCAKLSPEDCNEEELPGCKLWEINKCLNKTDKNGYCANYTKDKCASLNCSWCMTSSKCQRIDEYCTNCTLFGDSVDNCTAHSCAWCAIHATCVETVTTSTCPGCSKLGKTDCVESPGCCYVDNNCKEIGSGCEESSNTILIVIVCVCVGVVVVVAIIIIVVVVFFVHSDNKSNNNIEMGTTGGNIVVVSDNTMQQPQMADATMMASMDGSMMNGGGGSMMMNGGGGMMMDPSMMNSGMMDPSMMNSGMMDPSMMNSGMMGMDMNSGMMNSGMMNSGMGMTGGMNMGGMNMTGGMDMNMNSGMGMDMNMNSGMGMTGGMNMGGMNMTGGMDMNMNSGMGMDMNMNSMGATGGMN